MTIAIDQNPTGAKPDCDKCGGSGWETRDGCAYKCSCRLQDIHADGVPVEFHQATLANYRTEEGNRTAVIRAAGFFDGHRDLYLFGDVGSGKTRLACSILNEHVRRGRGGTGFFARVPWMLHQLGPGRDDAPQLERRITTADLIVLDDLAAERDQATDYTRRTLLMLYEQRHDHARRTIFTSNKSVQQLADMQDDRRLASRIIGQADVVELSIPDQRRARRRA
jgi:DNA replication protein DnaC